MATCSMKDCGRAARWQLNVLIWAMATAPAKRTPKNAAKLLTGLCLCDECRSKPKADEILNPEGRARLLTGFQRVGAALPDFSSVELEFVEVVDKPYDVKQIVGDAKRRGARIEEA